MVLNLDAQDMAYNAAAGELYVSVPTTATTGPAILVIDPRTGDTLRTIATPQIATPLAISDDAQFMYAGMGESGSIRRFALPALTTSLDFIIGVDNTGHVLVPADIRVAPGNAHTVAVTRAYTQLASAYVRPRGIRRRRGTCQYPGQCAAAVERKPRRCAVEH